MKATPKFLLAAVIGALALPAAAGSWPNLPVRKAGATKPASVQPAAIQAATVPRIATDGFEFIGGDTGWQLAQHKYLLVGGRFAHSDECDHAIRTAQAPTPREIESARLASPGA